jgi:hypothetical protein
LSSDSAEEEAGAAVEVGASDAEAFFCLPGLRAKARPVASFSATDERTTDMITSGGTVTHASASTLQTARDRHRLPAATTNLHPSQRRRRKPSPKAHGSHSLLAKQSS